MKPVVAAGHGFADGREAEVELGHRANIRHGRQVARRPGSAVSLVPLLQAIPYRKFAAEKNWFLVFGMQGALLSLVI